MRKKEVRSQKSEDIRQVVAGFSLRMSNSKLKLNAIRYTLIPPGVADVR